MSNAQPPLEFTGLKHTPKQPKMAAGISAVWSSIKHLSAAMSISKSIGILRKLNQKGGVDCPSCAWPDPDKHRSSLGEFCENGAKAIAEEATSRKTTPVFFQRYSVDEMASKSDYWLGQQGRLTHPMVIRQGEKHYQKISWEGAFKLIAEQLNSLVSPHEATFYTSGRSSNEAAFLYQLFVREFGTNNLPDCSNMCHESSGVALTETLGLGKGSVTLDDFEKAEVIVIMGQNPGTNHPRMLTTLEKAKKNGAKIVTINPLIEAGLVAFKNPQTIDGIFGTGTTLTDLYLQIRINSDMPLLKAVMKLLFEYEEKEGNVFDKNFINEQTLGFKALKSDLERFAFDELVAATGVSSEEIRAFAELLRTKKRIIFCWAMGLTQHKNAVGTIQEIVNILLLKGSIGIEGGGTCPVRGHSNVQGDRTMGIMHLPSPKLLKNLKEVFGFEPPKKHGLDVVESIEAMYNKQVKVFVALGGNFLSASPDTEYTAQALRNCKLTVHISTKLNRSHLIHGEIGLILPCLGRTDKDIQPSGEQFVTTENSMGVVQASKGAVEPPSKVLLSEPVLVARMAYETLKNKSKVNWLAMVESYDNIRAFIEKSINGFEKYNQRIQQSGGFYLPNPPREKRFFTPTQKAQFTVNNWHEIKIGADELLMMTIRSHDQFNTTVYGLNDRYRGIKGERRIVFMNPSDIKKFGLTEYAVINLINHHEGIERRADKFIVVPYSIPVGCIATYFPEANSLIPLKSYADKSQTPTSKSVVVQIEKV